jgi:transcriptional regulator with XRE-family HTH domain
MQWSEYTTAERLKTLRSGMTQEQLAEAAAVSVGVVRKLERGGTASLPSLLSIASALGTDIAVLLGQQAPRRSMDRDRAGSPALAVRRDSRRRHRYPRRHRTGHRRRAPYGYPARRRRLLGRPVHRARCIARRTATRGPRTLRRR